MAGKVTRRRNPASDKAMATGISLVRLLAWARASVSAAVRIEVALDSRVGITLAQALAVQVAPSSVLISTEFAWSTTWLLVTA